MVQRINKLNPQSSKKVKIRKEESDSDDDVPLAAKAKTESFATSPIAKPKPVKKESNSDDLPLAKMKPAQSRKENKRSKPKSESDDDVPLAANTKKRKMKKESTPKTNRSNSETRTLKKSSEIAKAKKEIKEVEMEELKPEEEDEGYKWWEAEQSDGTVKWNTLEHNGVLFPPPYEPLPNHVRMKYDGKQVDLFPEAEEVAGFFAALLDTDHGNNPVFQKNFFNDWLEILKKDKAVCSPSIWTHWKTTHIKDFEKCDFRPMWEYFEMKKEEKKKMSKEEKAAIKKEKDELEAPYKYCFLDGRKEMVGNFRIEPPGLFRGRGKHPKTGKLKVHL